jgi:hypothetical protein
MTGAMWTVALVFLYSAAAATPETVKYAFGLKA